VDVEVVECLKKRRGITIGGDIVEIVDLKTCCKR